MRMPASSRFCLCVSLSICGTALTGCGAAPPGCKVTGLNVDVSPASGVTTLDHAAKAPSNQQQFYAYAQTLETGDCVVSEALGPTAAIWTVSDAVHVQISSANDSTNGLATCVGATNGAATVTGTVTKEGFTATATSSLTCK